MNNFQLLGISLHPDSTQNILEKINKFISNPSGFLHIVSINPENLVEAVQYQPFKKVIETSQTHIMDGVGILWAAKIYNIPHIERLTGVDLMNMLVEKAGKERIRTMLIGGSDNVAQSLAKCYSQTYAQSSFLGLTGIKDIKNPGKSEEKELFTIVADYMPQIIFVSFGSPAQELWIDKHKDRFEGIVCMGVGGAFDFLSGRVARAPKMIQSLGLEWLYRLAIQPWRFRRQLKLLKFIGLIITRKF